MGYPHVLKVQTACVKPGGRRKDVLEGGAVYVGETARSLFERAGEHVRDAQGMLEDSHIHKHWVESHPDGEKPRFVFKLVKSRLVNANS